MSSSGIQADPVSSENSGKKQIFKYNDLNLVELYKKRIFEERVKKSGRVWKWEREWEKEKEI